MRKLKGLGRLSTQESQRNTMYEMKNENMKDATDKLVALEMFVTLCFISTYSASSSKPSVASVILRSS